VGFSEVVGDDERVGAPEGAAQSQAVQSQLYSVSIKVHVYAGLAESQYSHEYPKHDKGQSSAVASSSFAHVQPEQSQS